MPPITEVLSRWISDADARRQLEHFAVQQAGVDLEYLRLRADDYYLSLSGSLFDALRADDTSSQQWSRIGNAFAQLSDESRADEWRRFGIDRSEALIFSAAAFYFGGFPASACLVLRRMQPPEGEGRFQALYDFLARPTELRSVIARNLIGALASGNLQEINSIVSAAEGAAEEGLSKGPDEWVSAKLLAAVLGRFRVSHLRAILPDGGSDFWTPMIQSMLARRPAVLEFFPSQIEAMRAGLLVSESSFSLQMPTGAGKTALCETLLYWNAKTTAGAVAILLVPYRSLASELRRTLVRRLRNMGIAAGCSYGGTVFTRDEVSALDELQVLVATPETLAGLLSVDVQFLQRISLVICDEGHLLDGVSRGIGLELLLARFKARRGNPVRFVFVSAIVPNIDEINSWLGGTADSVVKSRYRPALAEFAVIRLAGAGASAATSLRMHPEEVAPTQYEIPGFLTREDFHWINPHTGKRNTLPFSSFKARAVAAARKALPMGGVAVFAANKRGDQGAIGIAKEFFAQLSVQTRLPSPVNFINAARVASVSEYLAANFGADWIGTQCLGIGVVLHHGDIPQETREVFETLLRNSDVSVAICTNTLAEGVNLPIRTLVLYSVERRGPDGKPHPLLARDIKNLVGRAGRAGASMKGLVICANENQWHHIEPVARQAEGEPVHGALHALLLRTLRITQVRNIQLTNVILESASSFFPLIDGIDNALIDLIAEEIGQEQLAELARNVAAETFAARQADEATRAFLNQIVGLRAARISELQAQGRVGWIKESGGRVRMLAQVEGTLLSARPAWDDITDAIEEGFVAAIFTWAWSLRELRNAVSDAYRIDGGSVEAVRAQVFQIMRLWLAGRSYYEIAQGVGLPIDDLLGVTAKFLTFTLHRIVEEGFSLLKKLLESQGRQLSAVAERFPEHLKYGVPTAAGVFLSAGGIRHRAAAIALAAAPIFEGLLIEDSGLALIGARFEIDENRDLWAGRLGSLVFEHTVQDVGE